LWLDAAAAIRVKLILSFGFVLRTAFRTPIFVLTIPKSRAEKRASAAVREINLAVAEHRLGVSNVQLSNVCQELADTKTLLNDTQVSFNDTQITLLGALDSLSALRDDRDHVLRALNLTRDLLNPAFPVFSLDSGDLLSSVESFASTVPPRLIDQHLRAVEERDEFRAANKDYAEELRAVRAEHFACTRQLACLRAENLRLQAELDSLRSSPSV
jgi:hypothetical protein